MNKAQTWTAELLNHYFSVSYEMFLCFLSVRCSLCCFELTCTQMCSPKQLLRTVWEHPTLGLVIMFVSGQTFAFVSLRLWEDHTHCLLFLLKSGSKVQSVGTAWSLLIPSLCPPNCYGMQWTFTIGLDKPVVKDSPSISTEIQCKIFQTAFSKLATPICILLSLFRDFCLNWF